MAIFTPIIAPAMPTATGATTPIALKAEVWIPSTPELIAAVTSNPVVGSAKAVTPVAAVVAATVVNAKIFFILPPPFIWI
jgi:hypothetical protein